MVLNFICVFPVLCMFFYVLVLLVVELFFLLLNMVTCAKVENLHFLQDFRDLLSASTSDGSDSETESTSAFSDEEKEESSSARMKGARGFKVDVLLEMAADSGEAKSLLKVSLYMWLLQFVWCILVESHMCSGWWLLPRIEFFY